MNAEQALTVLGERIEWIEADAGEGHQDLKFREARAFLLELTIVIILIIELLPILKVK